MMNNIPRLRARTGQGEDGKFYAELSMWNFAGTEQVGNPFTFGPFDTEKVAKKHMREVTRLAAETIEKSATGKVTGEYLDFKQQGTLRKWDES